MQNFPSASTSVRILWDHHSALLVLHLIDEEHSSPHVLKHNWLGEDEAKDKDVIQQASFAFKEKSVD
jgi:hypothetical protein